jgi:hypothetical protein
MKGNDSKSVISVMEVNKYASIVINHNLVIQYIVMHSASAYPRLQARVKRTIAYIFTDDVTAGFPTVYDSFNTPQRYSV